MTLYFFLLINVVKVDNFDVYTYILCKNNIIKIINCNGQLIYTHSPKTKKGSLNGTYPN